MKGLQHEMVDGRRLAWYATGQGRPLVLLHGWSMSAAVFLELAALLADDFRLLMPDLPGHGGSSPAARADLAAIAADLEDWLPAVVAEPVILAGWSLGGMTALELAHRRLVPVERLVLLGSTPRFTASDDWTAGLPPGQVLALARNLKRRFEETLADFFALAFAGEEIAPERLREIRRFAVKRSPLPDRHFACRLLEMLAGHDQRDILASLTQPALVLHGGMDQVTPVSAGRRLADLLPRGEFSEFAGVGHGPFLSRPRQVAARIREFC